MLPPYLFTVCSALFLPLFIINRSAKLGVVSSSFVPTNENLPFAQIYKFISAPPIQMDRRKAVTIGLGNRWMKPITFKVPDVIGNLLPSSSNIFKVHDDPQNNNTNPNSAAAAPIVPVSNPNIYDPMYQTPPQFMNSYDSLNMNMMTNFDANEFLPTSAKDQLSNDAYPNFGYPNTSFGMIDNDSQLPDNMQQESLPFGVQGSVEPQFVDTSHVSLSSNEKMPYRTPHSIYDIPRKPTDFTHSQDNSPSRSPFTSQFFNLSGRNKYFRPNDDEQANSEINHHAHRHQYASPSNDDGQSMETKHYLKQLSKSYTKSANYDSSHLSNPFSSQGDYYPRDPHRLIPQGGSGNYDYNSDHNGPSNFYHNMRESDNEKDKDFQRFKPHNSVRAHHEQDGMDSHDTITTLRSSYPSRLIQHIESGGQSSPLIFRGSSAGSSDITNYVNDSKYESETEFSNHQNPLQSSVNQLSDPEENQMSDEKSNNFDGKGDKPIMKVPLEAASYSNYFHTAASMLKPVILKSTELLAPIEGKPTAIEKVQALVTGQFTNPHLKANLSRPVTNRIKEFLKSMLPQKNSP